MTWRPRFFLSLLLPLALVVSASSGIEPAALLKLPLAPTGETIRDWPLTSVLSNVGSRVRGGYVLFGVEVLLRAGKEPTVSLSSGRTQDLGTTLREVLQQLPNYEMRAASPHLIEILPKGATTDLDNLLNLRVGNFNVTNVSAGTILSTPTRFIPELQSRVYPKPPGRIHGPQPDGGIYSLGWRITLQVQGVTLREILDRVSEATEHLTSDDPPLGWLYKFDADGTPGVPKHTWQSLPSVPSDWRRPPESPQ